MSRHLTTTSLSAPRSVGHDQASSVSHYCAESAHLFAAATQQLQLPARHHRERVRRTSRLLVIRARQAGPPHPRHEVSPR